MRIAAALVALALAGLAALAAPAGRAPAAATTATGCGVERWNVKTLKDPDTTQISWAFKLTTVRGMVRRQRPATLPADGRVAPVETQSWRIDAQLVWAAREKDSDIHLVITDAAHPSSKRTMIVELPSPACTAGAFGRPAMTRARHAFEQACGVPSRSGWDLNGRATVTGPGFWDFDHNQHGVAANAIELHPLVGFTAASCTRQH